MCVFSVHNQSDLWFKVSPVMQEKMPKSDPTAITDTQIVSQYPVSFCF